VFSVKETDSVEKVIEVVCFSLGINAKGYVFHFCPTAPDIIIIILNAHTSFFSYSARLRQIMKGVGTSKLLSCDNHVLIGRLVSESNGSNFFLTITRPRDGC
jgi:hypothetical protein